MGGVWDEVGTGAALWLGAEAAVGVEAIAAGCVVADADSGSGPDADGAGG